MTKEIPLTRGQIAIVDDEDYEMLVAMGKWMCLKGNGGLYAVKNRPRSEKREGRSSFVFMHNVIMNPPEGLTVDHKDRDGLNNQKQNMRHADRTVQQLNRDIHSNNKSGYKGIYWDRFRKKWSVEVHVRCKKFFIGRFENLSEAIETRNIKALEIYKSLGVLI